MTKPQYQKTHMIQIRDRVAKDADFEFMVWMTRRDSDGVFRNYAYSIENKLIRNGGNELQNTIMYWLHVDEQYQWSMLNWQAFKPCLS